MFIVKKKISGKEYYYARTSKRVDGKVKAITVAYLGKTKREAEENFKTIKNKGQDMVIKNQENVKHGIEIIYFVHGTTIDNGKKISSGWKDVELSELGVRQSEELKNQINIKEFDVVFCSDLKRAVESAKLTFETSVKIIQDKRLRECNYGDYNGKLSKIVEPLQEENITKRFPNGESYDDVKKRVQEFLDFLKKDYSGKKIAIVAHKAPQLALEVLLHNKTWEQAFKEDWRKTGKWQPGWFYELKEEKITKETNENREKEFVSFIQEQGLIWGPEPEIYGGLAGFYTYGPIGKLLKNKVENSIRKIFNANGLRELEGPTIVPDVVWKASGHLETFRDRTISCSKCKAVFRADKIIQESYDVPADSFSNQQILDFIKEKNIKCPNCKCYFDENIETQSLMMKTKVAGDEASLRPETATVTYLPYPRFYNFFRRKFPLGVFQIGKAYRNEISPRQHVLRGREFTQAEGQIFIDPNTKNNWIQYEGIKKVKLPFWDYRSQEKNSGVNLISIEEALRIGFIKSQAYGWCIHLAYTQFINLGIPVERIRLRQHHPDEKAFYADDAWDIEVKLNNYGWFELCGVHDRTDYDLKQHSKFSGVALEAQREDGSKFTPHILEIAFGSDRPTYALMDIFYEKRKEEEGKTMFKVPYNMAPIDVSIFPLMKKPELVEVAKSIKEDLEKYFIIDYDENGSIGKRYLRSATVGTPYAITIDFDSLENKDVTVRDRDSEKQVRMKIINLKDTLKKLFNREIIFEKAGKVVETRVKEN
jgi:glycyl-tRNA synthetase